MVPRWRHLALILLPQIYGEERPDSLYSLFFKLNIRRRDALKSDDTEELARIHAFAEWCACHEERYIWNAAGVAFYEHLFDRGVAIDRVIPWLSAKVYADVKGLLEWRLGADRAVEIEQAMQRRKTSHGPLIRSTLDLHLDQLRENYKNNAAGAVSPCLRPPTPQQKDKKQSTDKAIIE